MCPHPQATTGLPPCIGSVSDSIEMDYLHWKERRQMDGGLDVASAQSIHLAEPGVVAGAFGCRGGHWVGPPQPHAEPVDHL